MASQKAAVKRIVNLSILPGEPTDGTGRICVHLFVVDEQRGSYREPHVLHPEIDAAGQVVKGRLTARSTLVRMACSRTRVPTPTTTQGITTVTLRTDDPRAVTCPKCLASEEYTARMAQIEGER